jgi:hypothetical protein
MTETIPKLAFIEWADSTSPNSAIWLDHETARVLGEPSVCYTVGFIVKETETSITLAGSWSNNQCSGTMCIPTAVILRRLKVKI